MLVDTKGVVFALPLIFYTQPYKHVNIHMIYRIRGKSHWAKLYPSIFTIKLSCPVKRHLYLYYYNIIEALVFTVVF